MSIFLVLMCGLEALPGLDGLGNLVPPCAPEEKSNMRYTICQPSPRGLEILKSNPA